MNLRTRLVLLSTAILILLLIINIFSGMTTGGSTSSKNTNISPETIINKGDGNVNANKVKVDGDVSGGIDLHMKIKEPDSTEYE